MTIVVIDGQGGKMGKGLVEQLKKFCPEDEILAIGTNSIATAAMLKAGADAGATGEKPHGRRHCRPHGDRHCRFPHGRDHPKDGRIHRPELGQKGVDPGKPLPAFRCGLQGRFDGRICEACGGGSFEDPPWGDIGFMA